MTRKELKYENNNYSEPDEIKLREFELISI